jgi:hypothetical protein
MNMINSIFDGLLGYECLMLICGFTLFVFAMIAITVMIIRGRDFKAAILLIVMAIVLMGFPGIQAIKFSKDMVELDRIRAQPVATSDPAQKEQDQKLLKDLQQRAGGNPQLQAKVSDGYRAIGEIDTAYDLAKSILQEKPSAAVEKTLVPVLTAKLNQVQATTPIVQPVSEPSTVPANTAIVASPSAPEPAALGADFGKQREIASIAKQLQDTSTPLPAESHIALARAYVALDEPHKAQASVEAALKTNPQLKVNPALLHAVQANNIQQSPEH